MKNFQRKTVLLLFVSVVITLTIYLKDHSCRAFKQPFLYPAITQKSSIIFSKISITYPFTFIVYGDSREPSGYEKEILVREIIREKPDFVIHLGDMVIYGGDDQWEIFDHSDGKIIESGISFYPTLGNHEYYTKEGRYSLKPDKQLQLYFNRFKFLINRRWYSFRYGNSLFLFLDTNTDLSPNSHQYKWLLNMLKGKPSGFLFISLHHPPYTKHKPYMSRSQGEKFLSETLENFKDKGLIKTDIVFSGHTHNYERYKHGSIYYVVSGGGGSKPHIIDRDPHDYYTKIGETFHYCKITVSETKAKFEMTSLDKNSGKWLVADSFIISREHF